jgi:hypothetical protein
MIPKIIIWVMENLSILLDRAHRVVPVTKIGTFGTGSWTNLGGYYSNLVLISTAFIFFRFYIVVGM